MLHFLADFLLFLNKTALTKIQAFELLLNTMAHTFLPICAHDLVFLKNTWPLSCTSHIKLTILGRLIPLLSSLTF